MSDKDKLDLLLAAACGCILDFKQRVADYAASDPDLSQDAHKELTSRCELAEGLAQLLKEEVSAGFFG